MNPVLEKLNLQFTAVKAGQQSAYDFVGELMANMFSLRGLVLPLLNDFQAWAQQDTSDHLRNVALANVMLGQLAMFDFRIKDALNYCACANRIFSDISDEDGLAVSNNIEGSVYRNLGDLDMALKLQYRSHARLKSSGKFPFSNVACSYQLAELYADTGAYERALGAYDDCLQDLIKGDFTGFHSLALEGKAVAYHHLGEQDKARECFDQAIALCQGKSGFTMQLTRALSDYGTYWLDLGEYDKSIDYQNQAMKLRIEHDMPVAAITNMIQLGKVYLLQNRPAEAEDTWLKACDLAGNLQSKPKMAQLNFLLSDFYRGRNDLQKSLDYYRTYHQISEELNKEDGENKLKRAEILFAAEQTEKENAIIKTQKAEIERKNKELQETIDELTITKVSRRAKALTLLIAVVMIIAEEPITHLVLHYIGEENFYFSMSAKIIVVLSLKPIDSAIEHYLLKRIILNNKIAPANRHTLAVK